MKSNIDLRGSVDWQTQFDSKFGDKSKQNVACKRACDVVIRNAGYTPTDSTGRIDIALAKDGMITPTKDFERGIELLDSQLEAGKPTILGVDRGYSKPYNANNATDHFIVCMGRLEDKYLFYEVGTSYKSKGTSDLNTLFLDMDNRAFYGTTVYKPGLKYQVTEVRITK